MSKSIAKPVAPASSRQRANARRVAKLPRQADLLEAVKPVAATRAVRKAAAAPVKTAKLQAVKAPVVVKQPTNSPTKSPVTIVSESPAVQAGVSAPLASPAPVKALPVAQAPVAEAKGAEANAKVATRTQEPAPEIRVAKAPAVSAAAVQTSAAPVPVAVMPKAKALPKVTEAAPESKQAESSKTESIKAEAIKAESNKAESIRAPSSEPKAQPPESTAQQPQSRRHNLSQATKALVLQGGGALGAYQAGAVEVMHAQYQQLDWVAGVSIGAINGALIAGNPPERRVAALREFWRTVSSAPGQMVPRWGGDEQLLAQASAGCAVAFGIPGLFTPMPSPLWMFGFNAPMTGVYNTEPMRETLLRLVDFDLINRGDVRFSVGAVNVRTGNSTYFDNRQQTIGPEHIMASAALPPGFPAVHIDGEDYWDGGVVSNTPLQHVLDNQPRNMPLVVMQIDLFSAQGQLPTTMGEVIARQKDIQYSSRTRMNSTNLETQINLAEKLADVLGRLPAEMQQDPEVQALRQHLHRKPVDIVHLIYRAQRPFAAADFEFSRAAVDMHWQAGARDMTHTLRHPDLLRVAHEQGVTTYDLADETRPRIRHRDRVPAI